VYCRTVYTAVIVNPFWYRRKEKSADRNLRWRRYITPCDFVCHRERFTGGPRLEGAYRKGSLHSG